MLLVIFYLGKDPYALESSQVVEIVPRILLKELPHAPAYVAGLFDYRGVIVPVIDLCRMTQGRACSDHLSTRVILVRYPYDGDDGRKKRVLGLLAERVTETIEKSEADWAAPGVSVDEAAYLGDVISDARGIIQCLRVERLLPQSVRDLLFKEQESQP
ncbi:MAG TPA: chemotaxis protein CheW [Acidobacteriota bacterium]